MDDDILRDFGKDDSSDLGLSGTAVKVSSSMGQGALIGGLASPRPVALGDNARESPPAPGMVAIIDRNDGHSETVRRLESSTSSIGRKSIGVRSTTASHLHGSRGASSVRASRARRGSNVSEVSNGGLKEMKSQLLAMSTTMKRMRKGGSVIGKSMSVIEQSTSVLGSIYDMDSSENFGLMQPVDRTASVGVEEEDGTELGTFDQMDVGQLRAECDARREELERFAKFGQNLMEQMEQLREDYDVLEEEKEQLLEAVAEADTELEEARVELQNVQDEREKEAQQHRVTLSKLREAKQKMQDLEYNFLTQQEAFKEKEDIWIRERHEMYERMEEAKEDMQWHEEQAAAAIEIAEKKKPDLEALADICSAFTSKATRKVFFQRLKDWRDDNKKRRHALAILLHNARAWQTWEHEAYHDVWRKFSQWSLTRGQRKRHQRLEMERKEENLRAEMVQSCLRTIIRFIASAWRVCVFDAMHWWDKTRLNEKDMRKLQVVMKSEGAFLRATNALQLSEQEGRSEIVQTAYRTLWSESGSSHAQCFRKWVEAMLNVGAERRKGIQMRSLREEDVTALSARAEAHERQGSFLRRNCDQLSGEVQRITALARTHEREATRLRDELNRAREDLEASSSHLQDRERELSRLRCQLQAQLTKAQRRIGRKESHVLAPTLNQALQLAAGLRKHAEDTTAALSTRRVVVPRHSPHGSPARSPSR